MTLYPSLYQINTRILMQELGKGATLDSVPDAVLDQWASHGVDWLWLLGIWQLGTSALDISRATPEWRAEFERDLPDLKDEDIPGSPFAIQSYTPHTDFGGRDALVRMR